MAIQTEALKLFIIEMCTQRMNIELPSTIDDTDSIEKAYTLDSISMLELFVNIEDRFKVTVSYEELGIIGKYNLSELVNYLEQYENEHV